MTEHKGLELSLLSHLTITVSIMTTLQSFNSGWTINTEHEAAFSPPELPQRFAELRVVQMRVLVGQFPSCGLRPHHERVHGPLHVRLGLVSRVHAHWHGHEGPVVTVEHLAHRLADPCRETFVLIVGFNRSTGRPIVQTRQMLLPVERRVPPARRTGGVTR